MEVIEIRVAGRTFNEAPTKSTAGTVSLTGGWDNDFVEQIGTTEMYAPLATEKEMGTGTYDLQTQGMAESLMKTNHGCGL